MSLAINRWRGATAAALYPPRSKNQPAILQEAIYLDTETSHIGEDCGWIYQWAFDWMGQMAYGRRPSELLKRLREIEYINQLDDDTKCVIFIHNSSYDVQYLKDWLIAEYGEAKILATAPHRLISFEIGPWIIRCTYRLSGRSLAAWGSDLGIKATKKAGMIDYDVIRYQDTPLSRRDWIYMFFDVLALKECVKEQNLLEGDTVASVPLTSTGYVRRYARKRFKRSKKARAQFAECRMTMPVYKALHSAYAGGLTHGNRFKADKPIDGPVAHGDFMSQYPSEMRARASYPVGKFALLYQLRQGGKSFSIEDCYKYATDHCLLIQIAIADMHIKKGITLPYAQAVKFWQGRGDDYVPFIEDNGRILHMQGTSVVTLTELDLKWIHKQYDFRYKILRVFSAPKGRLPKWLCDVVDKWYKEKTELKRMIDKAKKAMNKKLLAELKRRYARVKRLLNGIYGMTATNPVRREIYMDRTGHWSQEVLTDKVVAEKLEKFYESKNSFMTYAWGVWTTALARDDLMSVVELIGYDAFIYADTDSAFFESTPEILARIEELNNKKREAAMANGAYVTLDDGSIQIYDQFDIEETDIERFKFLHAKAYAFEHKGELKCTIAGVTERGRKKGWDRVRELGTLDELREDKVFKHCGGTRCVYVEGEPRVEEINGHMTELAAAAIILPVEKTLHGLISKDEYYLEIGGVIEDESVEHRIPEWG